MVKTLGKEELSISAFSKLVDASILFSERVVFCLLRLFTAFQNCECFFLNDLNLFKYLHF